MVGILFIILCVILISTGDKNGLNFELNKYYLHLAVISGLITGFSFALGLLVMKMLLVKFSFPPL